MECETVQSSNACDDRVSGRRNGVHPVRSLFHKTMRIIPGALASDSLGDSPRS